MSIAQKIRRHAWLWLVVGSVLALLPALALAWIALFYVPETPRKVDVAGARGADRPPGGLVVVEGLMNPLDLGQQIETHYRTRLRIKTSERVVARYQGLFVGERVMVVQSPDGFDTPIVTGRLRPLKDDLRRELSELKDMLHPWMLVEDGPATLDGAWVILPMLMVPGLAGALLGGAFLARPELHPTARVLGRFGRWDDVASRVDEDMQDHGKRLADGKVLVSPRWVVAGHQVLRVGDLLCIRCDMPIRAGDPATLVLFTAGESTSQIHLPADDARTLLGVVQAAAPWVLVGGSEIYALWSRERKALVGLLAERRQQLLKASGSPRPGEGIS